jgi:5-oxoprolinase (ATP-hydrolysing) subunit C
MSLVVVKAFGLCTIQDLGRTGHMHEAVPPGGALVPELLVAANRAAGCTDGAPAIEVLGQLTVRAAADIVVATDRIPARTLAAGDKLVVTSEPMRCTYLAIRGGVAAPRILDGSGTLLCAGLGRPLRANDGIDAGTSAASTPLAAEPFVQRDMILVMPGPDLDAFDAGALAALTSAPYRVLPTSDRVGTRLAGPALPRRPGHRESSRPMVRGALEVPRDGQPIILGPEHPTTGGYPVIAVIATAELGRFFSIRLGGSVRFALTSSR